MSTLHTSTKFTSAESTKKGMEEIFYPMAWLESLGYVLSTENSRAEPSNESIKSVNHALNT